MRLCGTLFAVVIAIVVGLYFFQKQQLGTGYSHTTKTWENWDRRQVCTPQFYAEPTTEKEIIELVQDSQHKKIKVVGSGHSFSAIALSDGLLINLVKYNRLLGVSQDGDHSYVTVESGMRMHELHRHLDRHGLALENMGMISEQAIAGSIATGTHGTGFGFGSISTQVVNFTLILADGSVIPCSRHINSDCFEAGRVSLGALGILSHLTLRVRPAFHLRRREFAIELSELSSIVQNGSIMHPGHRFQFSVFPHQNRGKYWGFSQVDHVSTPPSGLTIFLDSLQMTIFGLLIDLGLSFPSLSALPLLQNALINDPIDVTFPSFFTLNFLALPPVYTEMELFMDVKYFEMAFEKLQNWVKQNPWPPSMFPLFFRFVKEDDIWLSTNYKQNSVVFSIASHRNPADFDTFAQKFEQILSEFHPRPHWGKKSWLKRDQLSLLYPRFDEFLQLREKLDPGRKFMNEYLEERLG